MKILNTIGPQFNPEAKSMLARIGEVSYGVLSQDALKRTIGGCEVLVVGLGLSVGKDVIDAVPRLKLIATATTGIDHIDVAYAREKGIEVLSLQDEDLREATGTAELAFGLLLALVRHIPEALGDVRRGNWMREKFSGNNLSGKTLGIVGLGRLGSMVAQYGKAFGMRVVAYDPYQDASDIAQLVDFNMLLSESDVVSVHAPLTDETANMFNRKAFGRMKQTALLVNTARGAIVNEADVLAALEKKTIAGYATDVLAGETELSGDVSRHPLVVYAREHGNLVITPHIGGNTIESRAATDKIIAKKVCDRYREPYGS